MRYRLGSFRPRPGSRDYDRHLSDNDLGPELTRALEEMLQVRLSQLVGSGFDLKGSRAEPPDLMETLEPEHPDRAWVRAIHDRLAAFGGRTEMRLLACDYIPGPDGFLTIAASAPSLRIEVFPGDHMQIGFASMRSGQGEVRTWPRLLREVCRNGSLVSIGQLDAHEGVTGIGEAVERFLSLAHYGPAVEELRAMRATLVEDAEAYFDEMMRTPRMQELMLRQVERIRSRQERSGDPSLYGMMNAVTATARDLPDWRDRLDLEEFAGRMARLRPPVPHRTGGAALVMA